MPRRDGIDVSRFQHPPYTSAPVDWHAVKGAGIRWAAYQALKGESPDPSFEHNREASRGIEVRLAYGYPTTPLAPNQPTAMPWAEQGRLFCSVLGDLDDPEGVMLDAEVEGITEQLCLEWLDVVEAWSGRPCAVYTGGYVAGGTLWRSPRIFDGSRPRVFAAYCSEDEARGHAAGIAWDAWQWTGTGTSPGVEGDCDCDQVDGWEMWDDVTAEPYDGRWAHPALV